MRTEYDKKAISIDQQLNLLEEKGMLIDNWQTAKERLSLIGYYRFSGYAYPFRNPIDHSSFIEDTTFDKIFRIYDFDRRFKTLLLSYLGRIEVALRTQIIDKFSCGTRDPWWFANENWFIDKNEFKSFLEGLELKLQDSREEFINHFYASYSNTYPPSWMSLQIISFGSLIKLFGNFKDNTLKSEVSKYFGCDNIDRFISWINTLVYLRNICSHHSRLWNQQLRKRPEAFNFGDKRIRWTEKDLSKLYYSFCIVRFLLHHILPCNKFKEETEMLLKEYPYVNETKAIYLGIPKDWTTQFNW